MLSEMVSLRNNIVTTSSRKLYSPDPPFVRSNLDYVVNGTNENLPISKVSRMGIYLNFVCNCFYHLNGYDKV